MNAKRRRFRMAFDVGSIVAVIGLTAMDWRVGLTAAGLVIAAEGWLGLVRTR